MRQQNILMFVITTFFLQVQAQTVIPPGDVSGTWLLAGSPYQIQGDIQIPNNAVLTIEPGVTVEFQGYYTLNVQGRLLAEGTETDTILFTVNDTSGFSDPNTSLGGWNGIQFDNTPLENDSSQIRYCRLEYGKAVGSSPPHNSGGAIYISGFSKIAMAHCTIINNSSGGSDSPSGGALSLFFSNIKLVSNEISSNHAWDGGAILIYECDPLFINNTIVSNHADNGGGGIWIGGVANPQFNADSILNNSAGVNGGGIICWQGTGTTLNSVTFTGNSASWGGGAGIINCDLEMNNCTFNDNHATNLGGGVAADFSELHLQQSVFRGNTSDGASGGIHTWHCNLEADLCQFMENSAPEGGGLHSDLSQVDIRGSTFSRNNATNGAGIQAFCVDLKINSCTFSQNIAQNSAGAIVYTADTVEFSTPYKVELTNSRFELNYTANLIAGVRIDQNNSDSSLVDLLIDKCIFSSNSADHATTLRIMGNIYDFTVSNSIFKGNNALRWAAGPFLMVNCQGRFINCLFSENQASVGGGTSSGGGAAITQEAQVDFLNCTFANNSSGFGGGLDIRTGGTSCVMNSIFRDNTNQQICISTTDNRISSLTLNYCNIQYGLDSISVDTSSVFNWGKGNMDADPLFVYPADEDFHLQDGSPCIGAGIDSLEIASNWYICPSIDLEGNLRPNPTGSMPDMGAYESQLGSPVGIEDNPVEQLPDKYFLSQNYPNPFNPITHIRFGLPMISDVKIELYDILGQRILTLINARIPAGNHIIDFDGGHLASGIYICRIEAKNSSLSSKQSFVDAIKLVLMK
jgi:hypothetical protein